MNGNTRHLPLTLAVLLLLAGSYSLHAEVTCGETEEDSAACELLVILGITEEPDPTFWEQIGGSGLGDLNPGGAGRGDGPPNFAYDAITRQPIVVWSYNTGAAREIVFSGWSGQSWLPTTFVTANADHDVDPRIASDPEGAYYTVWWQEGPSGPTVWRSRRAAGTDYWTAPELMVSGARPDVSAYANTVLVGYERILPGGRREVVVHIRQKGADPRTDVIATTERTDPIDVRVHELAGRVWVDWKTDGFFGYSQLVDGAWTAPTYVAWEGTDWMGVEVMRRTVRELVVDLP